MKKLFAMIAFLSCLSAPLSASAQGFDARVPLSQLISAFQNCGPPQVYQMLSPQLFQAVAMQTNGMGCYAQIAQAGPVVGMQLIDQQEFPNGTIFVIRVTHRAAVVDWFMGVNRFTTQVDYLNYQNATGPAPSVETGPSQSQSVGPSPVETRRPSTPSSNDVPDGCELYPTMCS
ncbi:MAG: hypothetical protein WDM79_14945 [Terricaulis sp.]